MYLSPSCSEDSSGWPVWRDQASISACEPGSVEIILSTWPISSPLIALEVFTTGRGQDRPEQSRTLSEVWVMRRSLFVEATRKRKQSRRVSDELSLRAKRGSLLQPRRLLQSLRSFAMTGSPKEKRVAAECKDRIGWVVMEDGLA